MVTLKLIKLSVCAFAFFASNLLLATNDPAIKLKEISENVIEILYSDSQNTKKMVLVYLSENYNLDIIIRRTLGRNWNKINIEHQERVLALIKELVLCAYVDGMRGKMKPEIKYSDTRFISQKRAEVPTFVYFSDKPISLTYRVGLVSGRWEIFDILVENISIVLTYRNQFDAFFTKNTSDALIEKLETLLKNENLGEALPI